MQKISQAFIFSAGRGERMRPITDIIPKPLVKINNKSIIDYSIEKLQKISSIKKIIINGFYLSEQIDQHIKNLKDNRIVFSQEFKKVETGGGLIFAKDKIDFEKPLLTINGDIFWQDLEDNNDIELIFDSWNFFQKNNNCDILLGLKKVEDFFGYDKNSNGDFNLKKDGNLEKISNSKMSHAFTGLQIINPKILLEDFVKDFGECFSLSKIFNFLINNSERIKGFELKGRYFHIGNVESISKVENIFFK